MTRILGIAALLITLLVGVSGCAVPNETSRPQPAASSDDASSATTATSVTTTAPRVLLVRVACHLASGERRALIFEVGTDVTDLTFAWNLSSADCEATRDPGVLTPREQQAVAAAGYTDTTDVELLYGLCAQVDQANGYLSEALVLSASQITEITAMLTLCPGHPQAGPLHGAVARTQERTQLIATGQLFEDGTHLVGVEVQPGTYAIDGKIANCYWARMDARGEIIDNNFVTGAGRVEATIRTGDHSFLSEGCGEWRKVH